MNRRGMLRAMLSFTGLMVGCGPGVPSYTVRGEVKVGGIPLEKGTITYTTRQSGPPGTGEIKNGKYISLLIYALLK